MDSHNNFDNFEGFQLNEFDDAMLLDENMPVSFPNFGIPGNLDLQVDPTFFSEANFAGNSQVNSANAFGGLGPPFNPAQNNASLTNQGPGHLPGLWDSQTGSPWVSANPNRLPTQPGLQHMQSQAQQGFQPYMPQNIQGRTRGNLAQSFQQPVPQYGQQRIQQPIRQHGQQQPQQSALQNGPQLVSRIPSADELRYKIKQPGTDNFQLLISNREEAKWYKEVYLSLGDVDKKPREDIRGREEELIGRLYSAIRHFVKIEEGAGSEFENQAVEFVDAAGGQAQKKRKRASTRGQSDAAILRLSPAELQMVCWELLEAILDAQAGISSIPAWYTAKPNGYGRFDSLDHRLEAVEQVLRDSKIMCKSLLDGHEWQARIAWNPVKEAQRKSSNKQINKERSVLLKAGSAIIRGRRSNNEHDDVNDEDFKVDDSELPSKAIKTCPETGSDFDFDKTETDLASAAASHASQTIDPSFLYKVNPSPFTAQNTSSMHQDASLMPHHTSSMYQDASSMHQDASLMHQANPFSLVAQDPLSQPQADYSLLKADDASLPIDEMSFFANAFSSNAEDYASIPQANPLSPDAFSPSPSPAPPAEDPFYTGQEDSAEDFFGKPEDMADCDWTELFGDEPAGQDEGA